jgi:hypothetical protein
MELPFAYTATDSALEVATPGGSVWVSPGAFGAHNGPHTGHVFGDGKANFIGYISDGDSEMVDLGNGNGIRKPGERWGYFGGVAGERIRNRNPTYVAPADGTLHEIVFRSPPTGVYFDNVPQWAVTMEFANGTRLYLDHLGAVVPTLRNRVLSELGIDLATYTGILSKVAKRDDSRSQTLADDVARLSRRLRESMADIVWAVDPRFDSLEDVVARIRETAFGLFETQGIAFSMKVPPRRAPVRSPRLAGPPSSTPHCQRAGDQRGPPLRGDGRRGQSDDRGRARASRARRQWARVRSGGTSLRRERSQKPRPPDRITQRNHGPAVVASRNRGPDLAAATDLD